MDRTTSDTAVRTAASAVGTALRDGARAVPLLMRGAAVRFAERAETGPIGLLAQLLLTFSFLFMAVPAIDLGVARWFAVAGQGFPLQDDPALMGLRELHRLSTLALLAAAVASLFVAAASLPSRWVMRPHKAVFVLSVYALGPGLLVNLVLKNLFGRARPRELAEFGGQLDFSAPWQFAGACSGNCSFTSGEAASAAAMLAVALIVPRAMRARVLLALGVPAVLFSLNRIAFGGHFLSDVVLSWLVVGLVMLLVRRPLIAAAARIDGVVAGSGVPAWHAAATWLARLRAVAWRLVPDRRRAMPRPAGAPSA